MNASQRYSHFMEGLKKRNPGELEFHQAVEEFAKVVLPYCEDSPIFLENQIVERLTEPDRIIIFRVVWEDDAGQVRVNRGYRVQFNNAIGRSPLRQRMLPSLRAASTPRASSLPLAKGIS